MKIAVLFTLSLGFAIAIAPQGTTPVIEHDPSRCFEVGTFPKLCAQVTADGSLGQARAYFRASRTTKWYYVELTEDDGELCSALPSPLPETRGVEYYIEVVDEEFRPAITPTTEAQVVSDGGCRMSVYETAGVVSVFSLATGALEAPAGFAGTSVATAGGSSGAGAAGGAASRGNECCDRRRQFRGWCGRRGCRGRQRRGIVGGDDRCDRGRRGCSDCGSSAGGGTWSRCRVHAFRWPRSFRVPGRRRYHPHFPKRIAHSGDFSWLPQLPVPAVQLSW